MRIFIPEADAAGNRLELAAVADVLGVPETQDRREYCPLSPRRWFKISRSAAACERV
jgi:hypothetical protein